ncbi:hypothetical protein EYF80_047833 [Liparis tanakae]|uniref:Uncharacterized protein n=1 Tax=Liparis tanakae TaxID=230148 RepID=A0A4Z2FLF8_9TELE|nr:hypothetical protein EYF80_047833 [Liparis tanakae]
MEQLGGAGRSRPVALGLAWPSGDEAASSRSSGPGDLVVCVQLAFPDRRDKHVEISPRRGQRSRELRRWIAFVLAAVVSAASPGGSDRPTGSLTSDLRSFDPRRRCSRRDGEYSYLKIRWDLTVAHRVSSDDIDMVETCWNNNNSTLV